MKYRVTSMPTFLFIYQGKVLETLKGANPQGLETSINKWKKVTETGKEKACLISIFLKSISAVFYAIT